VYISREKKENRLTEIAKHMGKRRGNEKENKKHCGFF
jgi:hypothetical protein